MQIQTNKAYTVKPVGEDKTIQAHFLALPARLYPPGRLCQNRREEEALLCGRHTLSGYFAFYAFVVYSPGGTPAGRFAISLYMGDKTAYLGFFECTGARCAQALFTAAKRFARRRGCTSVVGPVNASFWLGYRMKCDGFKHRPYFSEPYNLPFYPKLWRQNGFAVHHRYISNLYCNVPPVPKGEEGKKYAARLAAFTAQGYEIRSPKLGEFPVLIGQIYSMIMELYADFPVFKPISAEDFAAHYAALRYALAYPLTKIACKNGKAVGFFISVPDYGNALARGGVLAALHLAAHKIRPRRFVMLYMGVRPQHRGLGKAIAQTVISEVARRRATAIGAFIHEGKETERYAAHLQAGRRRYMLYRCAL